MKLIINTAHQRFGGAVQVALSFIHECLAYGNHEFVVWVGPGLKDSIDESAFSPNFSFQYFDFGTISFLKTFHINRVLQAEENRVNPDCIISTTGPTYFHSKAPQIIGFNLPLYIYPESPYLQQRSFINKIRHWVKKQLHIYYFKRDASAFVVQTNDVNIRVRELFNSDNVHTVSNTCSAYYDNPKNIAPRVAPGKTDELRILTISAWYSHKNLEIIRDIIPLVKEKKLNIRFILTLKKEDYEREFGEIDSDYCYNVGPVKPEEAPSLYNECDFMFLPTLAECFSASYPEAMKMKKPIITTDLGFARSICGDAAVYFEAGNPVSAFDVITNLISAKHLQEKLKRAGIKKLQIFDTPQTRAEKYLRLCEELAASNKKTHPRA